ncbi:uncharacterized protein N7518_010033 [Penicillium psychrosexuale]|uniref:uncharacterized protein n=1 Tax=Penicillium psychrosexuale TaxID=1002107 RepID=UPI00254531E9|nr:uncharacterized protein N7518_010033 [Penicillium psychrosexuale]KAJ5781550.1 hypothetical protein N7518_010033 [Penicillium psychrosexuale]
MLLSLQCSGGKFPEETYSRVLNLGPSSKRGSSYLSVCASPARARAYGLPVSPFWYGTENKSITFIAVMQPSGTLHHDEVAEKMMDLTSELFYHACSRMAVKTNRRKEWLLAEQRLLKKEHMIAHVIATDGEIDCGETIMFLISILDDALVPLNADTLLPSSKADVTDTDKDRKEAESRRDERRMQAMAVRAGANLYMNVLQQLPIPLSEETERRTLKRIELVMLEALASPFEVMHVPKKEIQKAILQEARPVFEQIVKEEQGKRLERFLKD